MKKAMIFIVSALSLFISCESKKNLPDSNSQLNHPYKDSSYNFILKRFGLMGSEFFQIDSNTLVFYCRRSFDSSFLIQIKNEPYRISGVYYIDPYFSNVNDSLFTVNYYSFFEGCTFTLDSTKWNKLKTKASELLIDTSFANIGIGRDGREYGLRYNFKSNIDNGLKYEAFNKLVENLFLVDIIQRKKAKMFK
jgi:hypothetical protein